MKLFRNAEDRKKKKIREKELNNLKKDIEDLENEMKQNEICFNMITDEYLLDSVIYEYNAQKAKMNYFMRENKKNGNGLFHGYKPPLN